MANNIFDYMFWRGDLSFSEREFNDVDGVILARLSYLPFELIMNQNSIKEITIAEMAKKLIAYPNIENLVIQKEDIQFLNELLNSRRFNSMKLFAYVNKIDEKTQTQFSAITIKINENELYSENMLVGGHSKGGNLAVYSAAFCSEAVQNRIEIVYNFDGPGFDEKVLQKDGYKRICNKVNTFVPQSSVVGMLLNHEERYIIVHSTQLGLLQHDLYSWSVQIDSFICLEAVDNTSRFIDYTLKAWIANLDYEQREKFVDTMYTILTKTNANTVKELEGNLFMNAITMLKSIKDLDEPTRKALTQVFMSLLKSTRVGLLQVVINKDLIVK